MKKDPDEFEKIQNESGTAGEISDRMEYHIAAFLNNVSNESISEEEADEIKVLYRIIGELESSVTAEKTSAASWSVNVCTTENLMMILSGRST